MSSSIPMTTIAMTGLFTPPASCSTSWTYEPSAANAVQNGLLLQNCIASDGADPACFPSGFDHYGRVSATQIYSPGYCPVGYTSASLAIDQSTTSAVCCLSDYTYTQLMGINGEYAGCTKMFPPTSSTIVYVRQEPGQSTEVTGPISMWAQPIQVEWQASDLPLFVSATTTPPAQSTSITAPMTSGPSAPSVQSTTSTTSTASTTTTTPVPTEPGSHGLSSGGAIGVGVGIAVGGIAILAALGIWFWRRRNIQKTPATTNVPNDPGVPHQGPPYAAPRQIVERTQRYGPSELDASNSGASSGKMIHELGG